MTILRYIGEVLSRQGIKLDQIKKKLAKEIHDVIKVISEDKSLTLELIQAGIEFPQDSTKGDYAFPCFRLAKAFRKKPDLIAKDIKSSLEKKSLDFIQRIDSISGFLNISVNKSLLAKDLFQSIEDGSFFKSENRNKKVKNVLTESS